MVSDNDNSAKFIRLRCVYTPRAVYKNKKNIWRKCVLCKRARFLFLFFSLFFSTPNNSCCFRSLSASVFIGDTHGFPPVIFIQNVSTLSVRPRNTHTHARTLYVISSRTVLFHRKTKINLVANKKCIFSSPGRILYTSIYECTASLIRVCIHRRSVDLNPFVLIFFDFHDS